MGGLIGGWLHVGISMVLPLGILVYLLAKRREQALAYLLGICSFAVSELLVCIPLFQWLANKEAIASPMLYTLLLALCAALLEGLTRWAAFRFLLKSRRSLADGLSLGIGHGSVGVAIAGLGSLLSALFFPSLLAQSGFGAGLLSALEALLTLAMQAALALLILRGVREGRGVWPLLALSLHFVFRAVAVLAPLGVPDAGLVAILAVITIGTCCLVYTMRGALGGGYTPPKKHKRTTTMPDPGSLDENLWK